MQQQQPALFDDGVLSPSRRLPVIGEQKDIRYLGSSARSILNGPATTGMEFWSINPYVGCAFGCAYCYARYAHRYVVERSAAAESAKSHERRGDVAVVPEDGSSIGYSAQEIPTTAPDATVAELTSMPPWLAFERRIVVKQNAAEVLLKTLRQGGDRMRALCRQGVVIGTATDPYQPAERRFRVTRAVLEVLAKHPGVPVTIITKSPLVTRDLDVLTVLARQEQIRIHMTITTLDRELARRIEPRAPTPEARLRALSRLREAGIDVGVNVMPILPGVTDDREALDALVGAIARAGATHFAACALRLRSDARNRYLPFIEQEFPHLSARYRSAYARSPELGRRYRDGLREYVMQLSLKHDIHYGYAPRGEDQGAVAEDAARDAEEAMGAQLALL
jgi:DNA repair photolyase